MLAERVHPDRDGAAVGARVEGEYDDLMAANQNSVIRAARGHAVEGSVSNANLRLGAGRRHAIFRRSVYGIECDGNAACLEQAAVFVRHPSANGNQFVRHFLVAADEYSN